ncbi:molybdenum ABC transporter ATP-binding protein [Neopusillimonas maritima]|jgi:molybdate transport system ATP-binding protein|uniref:Molybdenum ABC transporter ATP-binding protein n=1 Tax=Neopusillimonas maritima TaxID=2026239 RepID=A0ABX9MXX7_9BURK|nr:molybdenum ABC transporter ATP-binding protein [Neopusillimonas maritima]MAO52195.1 molybdenum ABC transporter ATP-binding protein [Pusillimonas sp.]MBC42901.1 molybdenum ABC transporter ATP-binding protein [Pusillimonas sp.]RII83835.1 molybdenum ABC transporter ATP-binding protein [Neopusillimonas maritima]|tara:strand:+ start:48741 stop:49823 length:1083 start_codon:yes stop_codon:yes gene_type:complete
MSLVQNHIRLTLPRADFLLNVDLTLPTTGITVLFGVSGSGKTSILRCVAGLERGKGLVRMGGDVWQDNARKLFQPTWKRPIGYVFQEASLFEHLNVQGNLEYGLRRSGKKHDRHALDEAVELLGIAHLLQRAPQALSGGERQRVAIARALAAHPQLLLLDEPMASLDLARRHEILPWLERLRDQLAIPMLYVTHSSDELSRLADHVVVMDKGQAIATGSVEDILTSTQYPALTGDEASAVLSGVVKEKETQWHLAKIAVRGGLLWVRDDGFNIGQVVRLRIMARDVSLSTNTSTHTSIQNHLQATVEHIINDIHPAQKLVRLNCAGQALLARITSKAAHDLGLTTGSTVWAHVKAGGVGT